VVRDRVALARGAVPVDPDRALPVEVGGHLVAVQVFEDGRERLSPLQDVGRFAAFAVHVDREAGVVGEEGLLSFGVAAVGAVGVGVEQLTNREPVVDRHGNASYSDANR
jgi:hypothetical protein